MHRDPRHLMSFTLIYGVALLSQVAIATPEATTLNCNNTAVITGFWPPTNEMLRPFNNNREQNPKGWQGQNWRNLGYDVYAFFPEFPPDGDPTNDEIGDPGSVGAVGSDFQVDYQDASADFWRIMDTWQPRILITTSRGGALGWELEAFEGGHEAWMSDRYGAVVLPQPGTVDPRSTQAITEFAQVRLPSQLPLTLLKESLHHPSVEIAIDQATSGNYLSGFVGLHGLYYNHVTPSNLAAGHIHVGRHVSSADAEELMAATLEIVLKAHPRCEQNAIR